jgi:hypothetical protein
MENVTKIDIISTEIYAYNELDNTKEIYPLTSEYDFFMNEFSDTQDLLTVNISDPIARIMRFYTIENSVPKSFTELDYIEMSKEQKAIFDTFVEMIKTHK